MKSAVISYVSSYLQTEEFLPSLPAGKRYTPGEFSSARSARSVRQGARQRPAVRGWVPRAASGVSCPAWGDCRARSGLVWAVGTQNGAARSCCPAGSPAQGGGTRFPQKGTV